MKRFKIFLVNGLLLTATSFIMRFIGFSFNVFISKKVGAEALGIFSLIMSVYLFFITLATSGINLAVTRIVVEQTAFCEHANTKSSMRQCFFYSIGFGIFAGSLLCILAKPITYFFVHNKIPYYLFYFIGISLPFISVSSCFNGYFTALRKNGKNAICRIFEQILKILATRIFFIAIYAFSGFFMLVCH
ncbi:MAG: oligosaccharide flippase family protein [Clostridia bacterium]|nr:oligosaccharide flippase family protein [Clostridia bacterium]